MVTAHTTSPWLRVLICRACLGMPGPARASWGKGTGCICPSALTWKEYALQEGGGSLLPSIPNMSHRPHPNQCIHTMTYCPDSKPLAHKSLKSRSPLVLGWPHQVGTYLIVQPSILASNQLRSSMDVLEWPSSNTTLSHTLETIKSPDMSVWERTQLNATTCL